MTLPEHRPLWPEEYVEFLYFSPRIFCVSCFKNKIIFDMLKGCVTVMQVDMSQAVNKLSHFR